MQKMVQVTFKSSLLKKYNNKRVGKFPSNWTWLRVLQHFKVNAKYLNSNFYRIQSWKKQFPAEFGQQIANILSKFKNGRSISVQLVEKFKKGFVGGQIPHVAQQPRTQDIDDGGRSPYSIPVASVLPNAVHQEAAREIKQWMVQMSLAFPDKDFLEMKKTWTEFRKLPVEFNRKLTGPLGLLLDRSFQTSNAATGQDENEEVNAD